EVQRALSELTAGYQQQSTAVSQTVTTLDELRSSAVSGNDRAREVLEQAKQVNDIARKGSVAVDAVTEGMRTIRTQVEGIATSVKEIQKATNAAVMATEDGSKSVALGLTLVETSRSTIQTLGSTIESSSKAVEQITYSVSQQTAGVTQINEAMNGILSAVQ